MTRRRTGRNSIRKIDVAGWPDLVTSSFAAAAANCRECNLAGPTDGGNANEGDVV